MPKQKRTGGDGSCKGLTVIADCLSRGIAHPFQLLQSPDAEFIILYLNGGGGGQGWGFFAKLSTTLD
jgi:hypothetical protein